MAGPTKRAEFHATELIAIAAGRSERRTRLVIIAERTG